MTQRRSLIGIVMLVCVIVGATVSRAQTPVTDVLNTAKHVVISAIQSRINDVYGDTNALWAKMAQRLTGVIIQRFVISPDETPEWRIHDWFTDTNQVSREYLYALTYGDHSGGGYASVTLPRSDPEDVLAALPAAAAADLRVDLATLDVMDSTIIRATDTTGRLRFGGRGLALAIQLLQGDILGNLEHSLTGVMDMMAAAALIDTRDRQTHIDLQAAVLEQQLLENLPDRNADVAEMNMLLNGLSHLDVGLAMVAGDQDVLANWQYR